MSQTDDRKAALRKQFETVRDERRAHANTAERIGNAFLSLLSYLDDGTPYLRKDQDEVMPYVLTLLKGMKIGLGELGIDSLGNAKLHEIIINAIKSIGFEKTLQGFGVWIDDDGKAHGQIDFIEVVGKAIFHELEIRRLSSVGGDISLSPASSRIERVEKVANGWKCYIKTDDGTTATYNGWKPGDQPRCQTFNIREGVYSGISNRYYWRTVEEVAEKTAEHDAYIILSNVANFYDPNGTDEPMAGDVIVLCGHNALWDKVHGIASSDRSRMNYTQLTTSGDSPTIEMYRNIYDFSLGTKNIVLKLSSEKITLRSSAVEWMSYSGDIVPNVIHMGKWPAQGTTAHKYESWQCDGATWLCIAESTTDRPGKNSPAWSALAEKGSSPYTVIINTDRGNIIHNGQGDVVLTATVLHGEEDITDTLQPNQFSWLVNTPNAEFNMAWNKRHEAVGNRITVSAQEIDKRAQIDCIVNIE